MLAHDRIIFAENHFLRQCPWILFGYVIITRARTAYEFDFNATWFGHGVNSNALSLLSPNGPRLPAELMRKHRANMGIVKSLPAFLARFPTGYLIREFFATSRI